MKREHSFFLKDIAEACRVNNNPDLGLETPGFITLPLCGIEILNLMAVTQSVGTRTAELFGIWDLFEI